MDKKTYHLIRCVQLGEMPLYLIFYEDKRGRQSHCVMLCTLKKLRMLLRKKRGFTNPEQYGNIVYSGHAEKPSETLSAMLKARYDFDINALESTASDLY
jgi:hypothetical protein